MPINDDGISVQINMNSKNLLSQNLQSFYAFSVKGNRWNVNKIYS